MRILLVTSFIVLTKCYSAFCQNYFGNDCSGAKINWIVDGQVGSCKFVHPTIKETDILKVEYGVPLNLSSPDYHCYYTETKICDTSSCIECKEKNIFNIMISKKRFIAPTLDESPVVNCGVTSLIPYSPIITTVHPNNFSIINHTSKIYLKDGTTETHIFHPGKIQRTVFQRGGSIFIGTMGDGTGDWKIGNVLIGKNGLWNALDYEISQQLKCNKASTLFLFDLSGSMNENGANSNISKLQQAKNASKQTLNGLKSSSSGTTPEVAVLGFSGGCVPDPTVVISNFETDLSIVESRIDAMGAGGGTPLAEAIAASECKLANHLAQTGQDKGKLIVLSDGQATCQQIRPPGTYNSGQLGQKVITVSASQCGSSNYKIKYYTIGFNIAAGSPAERDLQYLSQISGGKYLNVQSQTQLERAFKKFNRTYIPKPSPALSNLPSASTIKFDDGVNQINTETFASALKTCEEFTKLHPDDCNGAYNLALMQEANDFYKNAISNYQKYLSLCPNAPDKDFVEKQIAFLEDEFRQFLLFQKEVVKSDLEYLKLHFEKIQNGQSVALAEEFKGFLKEKGDYYKNLPELMGKGSERLFKKNCQEVASGLDNCAKTINRNPSTWDRDATPSLSMTYLNLERLLESF